MQVLLEQKKQQKYSNLDMVTKLTNEYKRIGISHVINVVCLLHILANLVAILRKVHYKGHITKVFEPP